MSAYDNWLATTPEDEEDARIERELRRRQLAAERENRSPDPHGAWADYVYDPLSRGGFE